MQRSLQMITNVWYVHGMTTTRFDYADKIAKLLAMAEGATNEDMAANYLTKASDLRLRMMISDEDIRRAGGADRKSEDMIKKIVLRDKHAAYVKARRELMTWLASIYNARITMASDRSFMCLYGFESDIAFIEQMYASLILQLATHMKNDQARRVNDGASTRSWQTSYAHGWVGRVAQRLRDARQRQEHDVVAEVAGTALVLRDRGVAVTKYFADNTGKLGSGYKNRSIRSQSGMLAGHAAGNRADIGATRLGGQRAQLDG